MSITLNKERIEKGKFQPLGCIQAKHHGITKSSNVQKREDFYSFQLRGGWLSAVNPYRKSTPEWHEFEGFRQGSSVFKVTGEWPEGREQFSRAEISIQWAEYETLRGQYDHSLKQFKNVRVPEIQEVAVFSPIN